MAKPVTPGHITALLQPISSKGVDRKAWSVGVYGVWVPFFTATNTAGETNLSPETLGAPVVLARDADGDIKFSKSGRPVLRVVKELSQHITLVRENFIAGLLGYTESVRKSDPAGYKAQVERAQKAGEPLIARDRADLDTLVAMMKGQAEAKPQAEAVTVGA